MSSKLYDFVAEPWLVNKQIVDTPQHMVLDPSTGRLLVCDWMKKCLTSVNLENSEDFEVIAGCKGVSTHDPNSTFKLGCAATCVLPSKRPGIIILSDAMARVIRECDTSKPIENRLNRIIGGGIAPPAIGVPALQCVLHNPWWMSLNDDDTLLAISDNANALIIFDLTHEHLPIIALKPSSRLRCVDFFGSHDSLYYSFLNGVAIWDHINSNRTPEERHNLICGSEQMKRGYLDGPRLEALFDSVNSILFSSDFLSLFIADESNNAIRMLDMVTEMVTTVAKNSRINPGQPQHLHRPLGLLWYEDDLIIGNKQDGSISRIAGLRNMSYDSPGIVLTCSTCRIWV